MKWYAMRVPNPVLTNAVAMKNAATTSQTTVLPKPPVASPMVSVPESTANETDTNARAPIGIGRRMMPTMVATKTARSCQARGSTPSGVGTSQIRAPTSATTPSLVASTRAGRAVCRDASSAMRHRKCICHGGASPLSPPRGVSPRAPGGPRSGPATA